MNEEKIFEHICNCYVNDSAFREENTLLVNGDSLELMKRIPDHSIALILTDPPYHSTKKKNIVGDTSFSKDSDYIEWMESYAIEWKRILKYNGSVFCFCSSTMSAQLQIMFSNYFNILSEIVWTKPNAPGYDGWKQKMKKEALRQWYPQSERIIFMENASEGNLFRSYFGGQLRKWRNSVGMSAKELAELTGSYGKVNHGGAISNWEAGRNVPSREQFDKIKKVLTEAGVSDIPDFDDIIRPFNVTGNVEFTDIWNFENVRQYSGKHPAEKPIDLLEHAIASTTNQGDIVLDCFAGSGNTGIAASKLNRKAVMFEIDEKWYCNTVSKLSEITWF